MSHPLLQAMAARPKSKGKIPLFFYGTLKSHPLYEKLTHEDSRFTPYTLHGFEVKHDKSYPYLRKNNNGRVRGELVDIDEKAEKILDKWEERYKRTRINDERTGREMYAYEMKNKES